MNTNKYIFIIVVVVFAVAAISAFGADTQSADGQNVKQQISRLNSSSPSQRIEALRDISRGGKHAELGKALADRLAVEKDPGVRNEIYTAIGEVGGKESAKALSDKLKTETDKGARRRAILSLGQTQDDASVPVLRLIFLDEKEDMGARLQAGNALSYIPVEASVKALEEGLTNKNPAIRLQAVSSLSGFVSQVLVGERVQLIRKQGKEDADAGNRQYIQQHIIKERFKLKE